jgi:hypothetical protein
MHVNSFRDLEVYRLARQLSVEIFQLSHSTFGFKLLKFLLSSYAIKAAIQPLRRQTMDVRPGTEAAPALEHSFGSSGLPAKGGLGSPALRKPSALLKWL